MNAATCSALSSVFPLLLITVMLERRRISLKLRRTRWYREFITYSLTANVLGLVVCVVGIQTHGLKTGWGVVAWVVFGLAVFGFMMSLMMIGASDEIEEDSVEA